MGNTSVHPTFHFLKISFASFISKQGYQIHLDVSITSTCIFALSRITNSHNFSQDVVHFPILTSEDNRMQTSAMVFTPFLNLVLFFLEKIATLSFSSRIPKERNL